MSSVVLGTDVETGQEVRIGDIERRSGLYLLGRPGMGKSALATNIALKDIEHGHGVFFLDPHGDAVIDLVRRGDIPNAYLFDIEDDDYSFGINLLSCNNVKSLRTRTATYTRAYNVFFKLWEDQFGPWLQLILQNVLLTFIENQDYTLADVPMFLNPRNVDFREHIVNNIRYSFEVADFWRYEFFQRRERDQQERVDAALTRLNTLLTHRYVRDIIGQQQKTLDFEQLVSSHDIFLFRIPANLSEDIKKFIGTMLLSELLHAVRARREGARDQFCLFIDEFHNFASNDDMATMVTEGRKFGLASTYMHVERFGQLANNQKLMGATMATVNKVAFQLTVKDAEEFAPEYAKTVEPTEKRREAELVISPHAVEDIWRNGHPEPFMMTLRHDYFRFIECLQTHPQEKYFVYDPENPREVHKDYDPRRSISKFDDWELYRSSADMIREGYALLNEYYYWRMQGNDLNTPITEDKLDLIIKVIECLGGVLGIRPSMVSYFNEEARARMDHTFSRNIIETIKDGSHPAYIPPPDRSDDNHVREIIRQQQERDREYRAESRTRIEQYRTHGIGVRMPTYLHPRDISRWQRFCLSKGMSLHEVENLIEWKPVPIEGEERHRLREFLRDLMNKGQNRKLAEDCAVIWAHDAAPSTDTNDPKAMKYFGLCLSRAYWEMYELGQFVAACFPVGGNCLQKYPVKVLSNKYEEILRVERPQHDLVTDMELELSRLPRFTAYAKIIQEEDNRQTVKTHRIETQPLPPITNFVGEDQAIANGHKLGKDRDAIEKEIRARQSRWLHGTTPPETKEQEKPGEITQQESEPPRGRERE